MDLEIERGFTMVAGEGGSSWGVQILTCWTRSWHHPSVGQKFYPLREAFFVTQHEDHSLEKSIDWSQAARAVRECDQKAQAEQLRRGSSAQRQLLSCWGLFVNYYLQKRWDSPLLVRKRDNKGQSTTHSWLISASRGWSPFWGTGWGRGAGEGVWKRWETKHNLHQ